MGQCLSKHGRGRRSLISNMLYLPPTMPLMWRGSSIITPAGVNASSQNNSTYLLIPHSWWTATRTCRLPATPLLPPFTMPVSSHGTVRRGDVARRCRRAAPHFACAYLNAAARTRARARAA